MEELTYPTLFDQTNAMVEQLKNHKGKKNNIIIFVHKFKKNIFLLEQCHQCQEKLEESCLQMYLDFLEHKFIPELETLIRKYNTWWSFKSDSTLQLYLRSHNYELDTYFLPEELYKAILYIADINNMFEPGNSDIIIPDAKLQQCLSIWVLHISDFYNVCKNHVIPASVEKNAQLQNEKILNELAIEIPDKLIYNDTSSQFWLHPDLSWIMKSYEVTYSWQNINEQFLDFCTTNKLHVSRIDDSIFFINPTSELTNIFSFKFFHKDQIENILKLVTKFLGRSKSISNCCKQFQFRNINNKAICFIDLFVNTFNRQMPRMPTYISLT